MLKFAGLNKPTMKRFLILLSLCITIFVNSLNGQSLYLDYTDLDVALEHPKDVKRLTIRFDESVSWLIEHAAKFTALKQLRLHRADLSNRSLPFEHLPSLESLELVECGLSSVPKGILKLSKLKKLDLSRNRKMNLELLQDLDQLESLTLRFTPIDERKEYIGNWPSLKVLVLDDNELTVFPEKIFKLKNLEVLSWASQKSYQDETIVIPEKICELSKLRGLFLENLWLNKLPENIGCLRNLEVLDISQNNQIENLPSYWQQQLEKGITVVY